VIKIVFLFLASRIAQSENRGLQETPWPSTLPPRGAMDLDELIAVFQQPKRWAYSTI
jgi:hypothetical protein